MKLLLSAAESSSDIHGAELVEALKKCLPPDQELEVFGVGGPRLRSAGLQAVVRAEDLSVMGLSEVFFRLPRVLQALRSLKQAAARRSPDLAILMDYPDFHFRLAKGLKRLGIPAVYYIPPKIWVWRKNRIQFLKKYFVKILSIFPFEEDYYRHEDIPFQFVGNPLVDELPWELSKQVARAQLLLRPQDLVLVLMPGSRPAELKVHFPLMIEAAQIIAQRLKEEGELAADQALQILMPLPPGVAVEPLQSQFNRLSEQGGSTDLEVRFSQGDAHRCLVAADVGLIKSGTSTLEAGLLRCCHVIAYRPSALTGWAFKNLLRFRGPVGLVNWVAGWTPGQPWPVPELLCEKANPRDLANEVVSLFMDPSRREQMQSVFERVRKALGVSDPHSSTESPSHRAAQEILKILRGRGVVC